MEPNALEAAILKAHANDDRMGLVGLYTMAADQAQNLDAECFFLTYAYIYALEKDHPTAPTLAQRLASHNRL